MDIRLLIFKNEGLDKVNDLLGPLYVENSMILGLFHLFLHHWSFSIYFLWEGNKEIFTWKIWNFILLSPKLDFETGKEGGPLTEGINIGFRFLIGILSAGGLIWLVGSRAVLTTLGSEDRYMLRARCLVSFIETANLRFSEGPFMQTISWGAVEENTQWTSLLSRYMLVCTRTFLITCMHHICVPHIPKTKL